MPHASCSCSAAPLALPSPPLSLPAQSAILSAICCVVFCGFIGCAFAHSICKMIGIYAYRLDAVTPLLPPSTPGYPFYSLFPTPARFSPAVTALPADFRPLSLAAGHCGYCPLSLPPSPFLPLSQCPGRCTCIFTCTAATTRSPPPPLSWLVTRFLFCVCYCFVSLDICFVRCVLACVFSLLSALSLFFSTLSTTHPPLPRLPLLFCPAALYPFRHPLSRSASASQMLHF